MAHWKQFVERLVMAIGFSLMFGIILLGEEFRNSMGVGMNAICGPLTVLPFHVVIFVLAGLTGVYASIIQKYTIDWELMKRVQSKMKKFQKEFREAQKSGNKHKIKKLEANRAEMMKEQSEMSKQQFKPMGYTVIVSIPLWMWAWWYINLHTGADAISPVLTTLTLPLVGDTAYTALWVGFLPYWIVWYFMCSLAVSQIVRKIMNIGGV